MSRALETILRQQKDIAGESPWIFPARRGEGHMTEPKSQLERIKKATGLNFRLHDLRRTFATHAQKQGVDFDLIRRSLNHKSGGGVTGGYIISQVEILRPVFDAIADGYHDYYDPDWKHEQEIKEFEWKIAKDPDKLAAYESEMLRSADDTPSANATRR